MQNRIFYAVVLFLALAVMAALMPQGVALAGSDDRAIDQVRIDFNAAFNARDIKAFARLIDQDAIWMPPGELAIAGRDKVLARYGTYFKSVLPTFELKTGPIQQSDQWAFLSGTFTREEAGKAGGQAKKVSGHYLFILKKQTDGSWKIARDIWNEAMKP
jgi:uncharacterized protein (TIGR02246 family)